MVSWEPAHPVNHRDESRNATSTTDNIRFGGKKLQVVLSINHTCWSFWNRKLHIYAKCRSMSWKPILLTAVFCSTRTVGHFNVANWILPRNLLTVHIIVTSCFHHTYLYSTTMADFCRGKENTRTHTIPQTDVCVM